MSFGSPYTYVAYQKTNNFIANETYNKSGLKKENKKKNKTCLGPSLGWSRNHGARGVQSVPSELPPGALSEFSSFQQLILGLAIS